MKTPKQWHEEMKLRPCVTENDLLVIIANIQSDAQKDVLQRAVDAEMELLALKPPSISPEIRQRMDNDRKKACPPEWLSQALNEGDGTYKP